MAQNSLHMTEPESVTFLKTKTLLHQSLNARTQHKLDFTKLKHAHGIAVR